MSKEKEQYHTPPIKIQGIKNKLIPFIKENLPDLENKIWYEPFLGSGVVGFNLAPRNAIFGDSNPYTIKLYQEIKKGTITSEIVREFLQEEGNKLKEKDDEYFYEVRNRFNLEHESLDFLFLNRSDFNGMIRFNRNGGFNVPYGHNKTRFSDIYINKVVNQVKWIEEKLKNNNWEFMCIDCFELLNEYVKKDSNAFIYLDPPYIGRNVDYYDSWSLENEENLQKILQEINKPFIMSTWSHDDSKRNEYLDTIWKDYDKVTTEHKYFVAAKAESRKKVIEVLLKGNL